MIFMIELISKKKIENSINKMAIKINYDFKNKNPLFISVLSGSFIFLSDLIRKINIDLEVDFIKVNSYENLESKGKINFKFDVSSRIKNRNIILIEDIIDTGLTINSLYDYFNKLTPKSISVATLLFKKGKSQLNFNVDYIGFNIPLEFVVGYGLDYNQKLRNLDSIFLLEKKDLTT
tara:strand:- start:317 stop:847 length:531 start_codon:yes stop_codon:yes gene_type:complete